MMTRGGVRIRAADPRSDRDAILAVLERNLTGTASAKRFDWLYLANPAGPGRAWLAEDAQTGQPVGTSAGFPKRIRVGGTIKPALNFSDFAIDRQYRSLGPALKLLRRTLEPVNNGEFAFAYEHSIGSMPALYARLGVRPLAPTLLFARPVLVTPALRRIWKEHGLARVIGPIGDTVLSVADAVRRTRPPVDISLLEGPCGEEFTAFEEETARIEYVRGVHDQEQMNWRVTGDPIVRHEILCARSNGRLEGYLVFRPRTRMALRVVDIANRDNSAVAIALLNHLAEIARRRGVPVLIMNALKGGGGHGVFRRAGFFPVSPARWLPLLRMPPPPANVAITVYVPPGAPPHIANAVGNLRNWCFSQADFEDDELVLEDYEI
jgi:hypothetical protein